MSYERATRGRVVAREILEAARVVRERTAAPPDAEVRRAMGQMIADGALLFGQAVATIERMRLARSMEAARQIANEFLADLGR